MISSMFIMRTIAFPFSDSEKLKVLIDLSFVCSTVFSLVTMHIDPGRIRKRSTFMTLLETFDA